MNASAGPVRFAAVGLDHVHVLSQAAVLRQAGGELVAWHGGEAGDFSQAFAKAFPDARPAREAREILEDPRIDLVVTAAVPDRRAALAVAAMRHGKDVLVDKPGAVTREELATLRAVQAETGRLWCVFFSERLASRATVRALELVHAGAVGRPLHTVGTGPHQLDLVPRPAWFFDPRRAGGILVDLGSHQIDQFLAITGAEAAEVVAAQRANFAHPERPGFEDFGELLLRAEGATGYACVDWFTPAGLGTWGDTRLMVTGSEGTLEVRKNCDPAGRDGGDHLLLVDARETRHIDCSAHPLPFASELLRDVRERTAKVLPPAHCFRVSELALQAQAAALGHLPARPPGA